MPLQQLVEYYNDRFEQEHQIRHRPFLLKAGKVCGYFGQVQISSHFTPVHYLSNPSMIEGHAAVCSVTPHRGKGTQEVVFSHFSCEGNGQNAGFDRIINLDRLTRTVHMLNYLPIVHLGGMLFLEVDPRHILGIRRDHGAYFAEVIERCGLLTSNVVISINANSVHSHDRERLLEGLNNYRLRGYRIAFNLGVSHSDKSIMDLAARMAPNYLRIHAPMQLQGPGLSTASLIGLTRLMEEVSGLSIIKIDRKEQAVIANQAPFDLIEGDDFDDYFSESSLPEELVDHIYP